MGKWKIACVAALLSLGLAQSASADEFTKLTLLTFSGPVEMPGISLAAGTYRFQLADPTTGRRVVKVSDKDGTKTYGMFLSIPNQRMAPSNTPVVMFKETAAGAPPAVQIWFYPGETYGYEFAYPHAQALRIARANHQSVLAYNDRTTASSSEADRFTSMSGADVARIDENDKRVSTDETLKGSSAPRTAVATSGATSSPTVEAPAVAAARPARRHLPRTASPLPLLALLSTLSLSTSLAVRMVRGHVSQFVDVCG